MKKPRYQRFVFNGVLGLLLLGALLLFLLAPRTGSETVSLDALPSDVTGQLVDMGAEAGLTVPDDPAAQPVTVVTRSNRLGWQETVYLLPLAQLEADNLRPGGNQINSFTLLLLALKADGTASGQGQMELQELTLQPGDLVSVRGAVDLTLTCGNRTWTERRHALSAPEEPLTGLLLFYTSGAVDETGMAGDFTAQASVQISLDLTYAGTPVAQGLTLTAQSEYRIYGPESEPSS